MLGYELLGRIQNSEKLILSCGNGFIDHIRFIYVTHLVFIDCDETFVRLVLNQTFFPNIKQIDFIGTTIVKYDVPISDMGEIYENPIVDRIVKYRSDCDQDDNLNKNNMEIIKNLRDEYIKDEMLTLSDSIKIDFNSYRLFITCILDNSGSKTDLLKNQQLLEKNF